MPFNRETQCLLQTSSGNLINVFYSKDKTLDYRIKEGNRDWSSNKKILDSCSGDFDADVSDSDDIFLLCKNINDEVSLSIFNGKEWSTQTLFEYDSSKRMIKDLKIKLIGTNVHVFYYSQDITNKNIWGIFHHFYDGANWHSRSIGLTYNRPTMSKLCVACYKETLYLSYIDVVNNNEQVIYFTFNKDKITWSKPNVLTNSPGQKLFPFLLATSKGLHFTFSAFYNNAIAVKYCKVTLNNHEKSEQESNRATETRIINTVRNQYIPKIKNEIRKIFGLRELNRDLDRNSRCNSGSQGLSNETIVAQGSNGSYPVIISKKDILVLGWIEMGRLYTSLSYDFGDSWSQPVEYEGFLGQNFIKYIYRASLNSSHILAISSFGTDIPNLKLFGIDIATDPLIQQGYLNQQPAGDKAEDKSVHETTPRINYKEKGAIQLPQRPKPVSSHAELLKNRKKSAGISDPSAAKQAIDSAKPEQQATVIAPPQSSDEHNQLRNSLAKALSNLNITQETLKEKEALILSKDMEIEKLKLDITAVKEQLSRVEQNNYISEQVTELQREVKEKDRHLSTILSTLETITSRLNKVEYKNQELTSEITRLTAENEFLKNENLRLIQPLAVLKEKVNGLSDDKKSNSLYAVVKLNKKIEKEVKKEN